MNNLKRKYSSRGQNEMVGFGLIIVLVAVVFIVFLSVYIRKPQETIVDYEANSFVQSLLQYTTVCEDGEFENLTVQRLISQCKEGDTCYSSGMDPCLVLNDTIKKAVRESWRVGPENYIKGYSFTINVSNGDSNEQLVNIKEGITTRNYRISLQDFGKGWDYTVILFKAYT